MEGLISMAGSAPRTTFSPDTRRPTTVSHLDSSAQQRRKSIAARRSSFDNTSVVHEDDHSGWGLACVHGALYTKLADEKERIDARASAAP